MTSSGAFGMKRVDCPALERRDRVFDKAAFIQRIGVDQNLDVHVIRNSETAIDRRGRRAPIFVKLQSASPCLNLFNQASVRTRVTLSEKAEVEGKGICSLKHPLYVPWPGRAGRGGGPRGGPRSATHHCGDTREQGFFHLLRTNEVHMRIDPAGSDNVALAGDHFSSRSNNNVHIRLHIGIAGFRNRGNPAILDRNIGLHNSPVIENECIGDDCIDRTFAPRPLRLPHAVANDFSASKFHFFPILRKILFSLDHKIGIRKAHFVANRWAEHLRVCASTHFVGHSQLPLSRQRVISSLWAASFPSLPR
jgi:hypothetical protein